MIKIYTLADPITKEVRYVGKTERSLSERYRQHICLDKEHSKYYSKSWIKSLKSKNLLPIIEILDEVEDNWQFWEQYWISQFKTWGFHLTNLTSGGEGIFGHKHSIEAKSKISKASKLMIRNKESFIKGVNTRRLRDNYKKSPENIQKLRKANLGRSPPNKGQKASINTRKLQSLAKLGKPSLKRTPINQYDLQGNFIKEWDYISQAADELKLIRSNIIACLKGRRNKVGDWIWKYK